MTWLLLGLSVSAAFLGWRRWLAARESMRWLLAAHLPPRPPPSSPRFYIIVPLLREQSNLPRLLRALARLHHPGWVLTIAIVTTQAEVHQKLERAQRLPALAEELARRRPLSRLLGRYLGVFPRKTLVKLWWRAQRTSGRSDTLAVLQRVYERLPTTTDLVRHWVPRLNQMVGADVFVHLDYPARESSMAAQANYAVDILTATDGAPSAAYVGLYTADALPGPDLLHHLAWAAWTERVRTGSYPPVFQQGARFLRNVAELPHTFRGDVLRAAGVFQTAFYLGRELPAHRHCLSEAASPRRRRAPFRPYAPVIGHGLFVRLDLLRSHGGLPTTFWCEDLALTFLYHLRGIPIRPLPTLEENETPFLLRGCIAQGRTWYSTAMRVVSLARFARHHAERPRRGLLLGIVVQRVWLNIEWALGGPLCIIVGALSFRQHTLLGVLSVASALTYLILPQAEVLRDVGRGPTSVENGHPRARSVRMLLASLVFTVLVSPAGPWQAMLVRLARIDVAKAKTER